MPPKKTGRGKPAAEPKVTATGRTTRAAARAVTRRVDDEAETRHDGMEGVETATTRATRTATEGSPSRKTPPKKSPPKQGAAKRKSPDGQDDDSDDSKSNKSDKKPDVRPAKRVKQDDNQNVATSLRNQIEDMGIKLEGDPTNLSNDELREAIDNWLDDLETVIRGLGLVSKTWANYDGNGVIGLLDLKNREETESRWGKRQEAGTELLDEVNPFRRINLKTPHDLSHAQLGSLARQIGTLLENYLEERGVVLVKNPTPSLNVMFKSYKEYGTKAPEPDRKRLEQQCTDLGLDTNGHIFDLQRRLMQYELAASLRRHGLSQKQIDAAIQALSNIEPPEDEEQVAPPDAEKPGDVDSPSRKGTDGPKTTAKGTSGAKATGKGKPAKKAGGTKTKKGAKTDPKTAKTKKRKAKALTEADKRAIAVEPLQDQAQHTIRSGNWTRTFQQTNVSGAGNRCFYRAIAHAWTGSEDDWHDVWQRARELWRAVIHTRLPRGHTSPAYLRRRSLYLRLREQGDSLNLRIGAGTWGDSDAAQVMADALDVQIFMYQPPVIFRSDGSAFIDPAADWVIQVRGRHHAADRRIHLINWSPYALHWTVLNFAGDIGEAPSVHDLGRIAVFGTTTQPLLFSDELDPLVRLRVGDSENVELRPAGAPNVGNPLDGHVANTSSMAESEAEALLAEADEEQEGEEEEGEEEKGEDDKGEEEEDEGEEDEEEEPTKKAPSKPPTPESLQGTSPAKPLTPSSSPSAGRGRKRKSHSSDGSYREPSKRARTS